MKRTVISHSALPVRLPIWTTISTLPGAGMTNYQHDILVAHVYCAAAMAVTPKLFALVPVVACIGYMIRAWRDKS